VLDKDYTGTPETVLHILRTAYGPNGAQSWAVRKWVEDVIRQVRPRDYWSEALAVYYYACSPRFRYTHDPQKVELIKSPEKMLNEVQARGATLGDCDDVTTFILSSLSVIGIPGRVATGAFDDVDPLLAPKLGMERPERFGFSLRGPATAHGPFSHVWAEGMRPDGVWVMLDPVAGPDSGQMRRRLKQIRHYMVS
jgi:transglutaminase-like putative cysteine protease